MMSPVHRKPITDPDMAAALATLGFPVDVKCITDSATGKTERYYLVSMAAVDAKYKLSVLLREMENCRLEKNDFDHPLLFALTGIKNLHAIRRAIKFQPINMQATIGKRRTVLTKPPRGMIQLPRDPAPPPGFVAIDSIHKAAALCAVGFLPHARSLPFERFLFAPAHYSGFPLLQAELARIENEKEDGYWYALGGAQNRDKLAAAEEKAREILIRKPGGGWGGPAAFVNPNISSKGLEKVERFFYR